MAAQAAAAAIVPRPGDWACTACDNLNFAYREECFLCSLPREAVETITTKPAPHTADWPCPYCKHSNFARRFACNSCGMPVPGVAPEYEKAMEIVPPGPDGKGGSVGKAGGLARRRAAIRAQYQPTPPWPLLAASGNPLLSGLGAFGGLGKGGFGKGGFGGPGAFGSAGKGFGGWGGGGSGYGSYGYSDYHGMLKTGPPPMPGDWLCTKCANVNFARRDQCNHCGVPRAGNEEDVMTSSVFAGYALNSKFVNNDWLCASCGNNNFARRTSCHRCNVPKPEEAKATPTAAEAAAPY